MDCVSVFALSLFHQFGGWAPCPQHACALGKSAGVDGLPRRTANGSCNVGVLDQQALGGQPVQVGRQPFELVAHCYPRESQPKSSAVISRILGFLSADAESPPQMKSKKR